jgi:hypothetical protein
LELWSQCAEHIEEPERGHGKAAVIAIREGEALGAFDRANLNLVERARPHQGAVLERTLPKQVAVKCDGLTKEMFVLDQLWLGGPVEGMDLSLTTVCLHHYSYGAMYPCALK